MSGLPVEEDLVIVNRNDSFPIFERTNLIGCSLSI